MMISPESYMETIKDLNFEQLVKERNKLIRELHRFEKKNDDVDMEVVIHPSPDVVYQCNNQYLIKATELINIRFREMNELED